MTELQKMLNSELYNPYSEQLLQLRIKTRSLLTQYNQLPYEDFEERKNKLKQLLGDFKGSIDIQAPFYCDYGCNIFAGENLYLNYNCIILDCAKVVMGNHVFLGPNVQLYTASHPLKASERIKGLELAYPIQIGNQVWIGGGSIVCPGVTIGDIVD